MSSFHSFFFLCWFLTVYQFHVKSEWTWKWIVRTNFGTFEGLKKARNLRGAWTDRDTNDIAAHCSLISYFLDFKFSNFVCLSELHPLIWFFFKNSFRKKKSIRKNHPKRLSSKHLHSFINRAETWYTASTHPSAKYVVTEFSISL